LIRRLLSEERGYSLVEVMVSIVLLTIAILPMVGMFDMGLNNATTAGNYDSARALANSNLDKVRALPWSSVTGPTSTYEPVNAPITGSNPAAGQPVICDQGVFTCSVTTTYVNDENDDFSQATAVTTRVRAVVTVTWQGKSYTATGLKAR
jgi:prepilin-type N-terminal cleavage/methylation domain-containing protein